MVMHGILKGHPRARFCLVVVFVLVCGISLTILWVLKLQSPFSQAVYNRIHLGMRVEQVTKIVGLPPGYYKVSPEEKFVNMRHEGIIVFGKSEEYEDVETESAIYDIVSRETGKPVAGFQKWVNDEDGILILTQEDKVIGKMYLVSLTSNNRRQWLSNLRRWLGL